MAFFGLSRDPAKMAVFGRFPRFSGGLAGPASGPRFWHFWGPAQDRSRPARKSGKRGSLREASAGPRWPAPDRSPASSGKPGPRRGTRSGRLPASPASSEIRVLSGPAGNGPPRAEADRPWRFGTSAVRPPTPPNSEISRLARIPRNFGPPEGGPNSRKGPTFFDFRPTHKTAGPSWNNAFRFGRGLPCF